MKKTWNKNIATATLICALASCSDTGRNPTVVADDLNHRFIGQPANDFFRQYGLPGDDFELSEGGTVYRWASVRSAMIPADVTVRRYTSPDGTYEVADTYSLPSEAQYCELRIYADSENVIEKFAVSVDTMGKWSSSRCSEIFEEIF